MGCVTERKVITGSIAVDGTVTYDEGRLVNADGVVNLGICASRIAICVTDVGGAAVDWSVQVYGLPDAETSIYGDIPTIGEAVVAHTDTTQTGAIAVDDVAGICSAIHVAATITDEGTATSFRFQIVALGY